MKRALLGLALAAILPVSAQAADNAPSSVSYSYVQAGYIQADWFDANLDGFSLAGSLDFTNNWYGSVNYSQVSQDEVTLDRTDINLGWHHALSDKADFLAEVGYARLGVDIDGFGDESSDGYRAAIGFRGMMAPKFEGSVKGTWTKINDLDDGEFGINVGATYHFTPTWGLTGSYEHTQLLDEDMDIWGLGVRATF